MKNQSNAHYIGFPTLEGWAEIAQPDQPVYCMTTATPGQPDRKYGMALNTHAVMVEQIDQNCNVSYCKIIIGYIQTISNGQPLDSALADQVIRKSRAAHSAIIAWLKERFEHVIEATLAIPLGYMLLRGQAEFLDLSKLAAAEAEADHAA